MNIPELESTEAYCIFVNISRFVWCRSYWYIATCFLDPL